MSTAQQTVVRTKHGWRVARRLWRVVLYTIVLAGAILYSTPFIWMLSTSVKPGYQVYRIPPEWIPDRWEWLNYVEPWDYLPFAQFYLNTTFITVTSIIGTLISASLVAFAFARMRFWGRDVLFLLVLATMMLPNQVTLIPIYVWWSKLGGINTYWPLILPNLFGGPFNIFLLRQYMMTIPLEMDDAARIDGASWFQVYYRIVLPMAAPALGVVAIFGFNREWNDFLGPLIYLNELKTYTVALGLTMLNSRLDLEIQKTMAQTILAIIPVLIVFFITQRYYIQGIVISGVKG